MFFSTFFYFATVHISSAAIYARGKQVTGGSYAIYAGAAGSPRGRLFVLLLLPSLQQFFVRRPGREREYLDCYHPKS